MKNKDNTIIINICICKIKTIIKIWDELKPSF